MHWEHKLTVDIVDVQHAVDYFGPTVLLCGGEVSKQPSYQRCVFDETTQDWSNYVCFRENLSATQESQNYKKPTKITRFQDWRMFKGFCRSLTGCSFLANNFKRCTCLFCLPFRHKSQKLAATTQTKS